jgi:hypothetical protein
MSRKPLDPSVNLTLKVRVGKWFSSWSHGIQRRRMVKHVRLTTSQYITHTMCEPCFDTASTFGKPRVRPEKGSKVPPWSKGLGAGRRSSVGSNGPVVDTTFLGPRMYPLVSNGAAVPRWIQ